ncbi:MAG: DegV family protein [Firmicutes bacterium]|nr:DegV family protein [Bacillota bacterium]
MIRILTDTSSGFAPADVKKIGVEMASLPINFDGEEFLDGIDISHEEFYVKQKQAKEFPKTSAVNQTAFEEFFLDAKNKGDDMIVLTISKELSLTNSQAIAAKNAVGYDRIYILNTLTAATPLIALVLEAVRMRNEKMKVSEIVAELERLIPKAKLFAYVDTLKYLKAGGRISGTSATIGTMIGLKPIMTLIDGKVAACHKCIGARKAQGYIVSQLKTRDVDFSRPVYFAHTNVADECEALKAQAKKEHNFIDGGTWWISATVAVHAGPGAVAVAFFEK